MKILINFLLFTLGFSFIGITLFFLFMQDQHDFWKEMKTKPWDSLNGYVKSKIDEPRWKLEDSIERANAPERDSLHKADVWKYKVQQMNRYPHLKKLCYISEPKGILPTVYPTGIAVDETCWCWTYGNLSTTNNKSHQLKMGKFECPIQHPKQLIPLAPQE